MSAPIIIPGKNKGMYVRKNRKLLDGFLSIEFKDIDQHNIVMTLADFQQYSTVYDADQAASRLIVSIDTTCFHVETILLEKLNGMWEFYILVYET